MNIGEGREGMSGLWNHGWVLEMGGRDCQV